MNDGGRDDNTGTKLSHGNNDSALHAKRSEPRGQDRRVNANSAGRKDHKQEADTQGYIVVSFGRRASGLHSVTIRIDAVSDSG